MQNHFIRIRNININTTKTTVVRLIEFYILRLYWISFEICNSSKNKEIK